MRQERLTTLIAPVISALGYELWGVVLIPRGKQSTLRVYIDKPDTGVNIDDCALVSGQLSAFLTVEEPKVAEYALEVSSPGLERELFTKAHYERYVGQRIKVSAYAPIEGQRKFSGNLLRVSPDGILIETERGEVSLTWQNIAKANVSKF